MYEVSSSQGYTGVQQKKKESKQAKLAMQV